MYKECLPYIFYSLFYILQLSAAEEQFTCRDSIHAIVAHNQREQAQKKWDLFQEEMAWYLYHYKDPLRQFSAITENNTLEEIELKNYLKERWTRQHQTLEEDVIQVQKAFLDFRNKVASTFSSNYGDSQYGYSMNANANLELTEWYIDYMEKNLFPIDWQERYKHYLQERKKQSNQNENSTSIGMDTSL